MALTKVLLVLCLAVACISGFSITGQMQAALVSTIESRTRTWVAQAYDQREKFGVMSMGLRRSIQNGPVVVQFEVFDDFYQYKSGVYRHVTGTTRGWHVVRVIGWGVENGVKYWLIANSWGARWGDKGFVKFVRGENHLEIENFVYAGLPKY